MKDRSPIFLMAAFIVIIVIVSITIYSCVNDSCEARGGHLERIHGGNGGYICMGADK